ncbi:helix-turn-helix domain-containing protein [Clostridium sp. ZS2-4]|uniref:helix-turn-helix domain-containing protein n=1 Tax=Clostridium sp. ZS2-4 TaxID=2987703 RepID=UPI00227D2252|nr:helix-turn-helix transcriptional regulator [Clostridium sp. ZS2-4]MCY6354343.1 helix-turn-helix transcriptional regulator [Clostridium sp. ZS2-4]
MSMLGNNIKTLREKYNLSQEQLSKKTGISRSNIGKIEKNQISPSVDALVNLANFFEVSTDVLLNENNFEDIDIKTDVLSEEEKNIIYLIRNVSDEDKKLILKFLNKFKE